MAAWTGFFDLSEERRGGLILGRLWVGDSLIEGVVALDVSVCSERAISREELVNLSDFRSRTHPESDPVGATPCHSLLLAGQAILGPDLHEWLFLLVTA